MPAQQKALAVNPVVSATGDEGQTTNTSLKESVMSVELAAQIGTNWSDLAAFEREILTEAHAGGIELELLRSLAEATAVNRRAEVNA